MRLKRTGDKITNEDKIIESIKKQNSFNEPKIDDELFVDLEPVSDVLQTVKTKPIKIKIKSEDDDQTTQIEKKEKDKKDCWFNDIDFPGTVKKKDFLDKVIDGDI